jgi:homoserine kinase
VAAPLKLKLPATSANLGPGFDALGLAMDFALHIEARESDAFSIHATGRNVAQCGDVADSLVIETYKSVLREQGIDPVALHLDLHNEIPLGMGCGSSAAALVAGVALASHFGGLKWSREKMLTEASLLEGHPDNVAACVLGGLTVSSMVTPEDEPPVIDALPITPPVNWPLLVVMPESSLSTKKARALLPESYSKADAIANVQAVSLLVTAFAQGRGDLLERGMRDRMHQPYRGPACPLLGHLLPLAGRAGILGVALSGAGPSVLLIVSSENNLVTARTLVRSTLANSGSSAEILNAAISGCAVIF